MTNKGKVLAAVIAVAVVLAGGVGLYFKGGDLMGKIFGSGNITRAELAKVVVAAAYPWWSAEAGGGSCFSDVPEDSWYVDYVCYLVNKDIMKGDPDGTFGPKKTVSRAEAAEIFWSAYVDAVGGEDNVPQTVNGAQIFARTPYSDVSNDTWYYQYVVGDAALGILDVKAWAAVSGEKGSTGKNNKFYPGNLLTKGRAQSWADKLSAVLGY
ncbi:MAG: S-layer homology domain-containing protein [Candidatus Gracilibacteria bacterium]